MVEKYISDFYDKFINEDANRQKQVLENLCTIFNKTHGFVDLVALTDIRMRNENGS